MFGLFPRKGTIAVGSDADIVVFDPNRSATLGVKTLHMKVDYNPYEGRTVQGAPSLVICNGRRGHRRRRVRRARRRRPLPPPRPEPRAGGPVATLSPMHSILLVEDDRAARDGLEPVADDGRIRRGDGEGRRRRRSSKIDRPESSTLMLLDIWLPRMTGLELLAQLPDQREPAQE